MIIETKDKGIEIINNAFPYPNQISDWDTKTKVDAIYFTWRGNRFKLDLGYASVSESDGHMLRGTDLSILAEALIKRAMIQIERA